MFHHGDVVCFSCKLYICIYIHFFGSSCTNNNIFIFDKKNRVKYLKLLLCVGTNAITAKVQRKHILYRYFVVFRIHKSNKSTHSMV